MAMFDCPVATLDLLGRDSLVLGSLLHTLGTVMYCATNAPLAPTMAAALLDFLWVLRYHNEAYVLPAILPSHNRYHVLCSYCSLYPAAVGMFVRVFCLP